MAEKLIDVVDDEPQDGLQPLVLDDSGKVLSSGADDLDIEIDDSEPVVVEESAEPAESAEPDVGSPDEPDDAEFKSFTPAFQKRLQREIRVRRKSEETANLAVVRVRDEITKVQQVASYAAKLEADNNELQRQYAEVLVHAFDNQIEVRRRDLKTARDNNEFDTEQKLQGELDELRFKQNQVKDMQRQIPETAVAAPQAAAPPPPASKPPNPLALRWVRENKGWFDNTKFSAHRQFAMVEDSKLTMEGYDQNSSEYYKELDRRVDVAFPTLRRKTVALTTTGQPVAAVSAGSAAAVRSNKIKLSRSDLDAMRKFGLDPTNKLHLREYAKQVRDAREVSI